jgi:hypothetical protein
VDEIFYILFYIFLFLSRSNFLLQSKHFSLYGEQNSCSQFLQFIHSIHLSSLVVCKYSFFSTHSISFQNLQVSLHYEYIFLMKYFSVSSDLVDQSIGTVYTFEFPLLFDFISFLILSLFLGIIRFFRGNKGVAFLKLSITFVFSVLD